MTGRELRATAFRGDADVPELLAFFRPERHYDGHTRWTFGTSMKSAYVNCWDFMSEPPLVQLWRNTDQLVAVSRAALGAGAWFHQTLSTHDDHATTAAIVAQADAAFALLTDLDGWHTVCHQSDAQHAERLGRAGYVQGDVAEVYMVQPLEESPASGAGNDGALAGVEIRLLDTADAGQVDERALAQVDAFSDGQPTAAEQEWIRRSVPRQLSYDRPGDVNVIAQEPDGSIVAFADVFLDRDNRIGEFEPVGTRHRALRRGLAKAVTRRCLHEMQAAGMEQAVVRTGADNMAAIAAYESIGFETVDLLYNYRKLR